MQSNVLNIKNNEINEIWKPIVGFEGFYETSSLGRIKSLPRIVPVTNRILKNERILKLSQDKDGYYFINLKKNKKNFNLFIHRLVAMAFIPNPNNKSTVNHKNGIKTDNTIENLEWCTDLENYRHAESMDLINCKYERNGNSKLTWKDVNLIRNYPYNKNILSFLSKKFNVSKSHVFNIRKGKAWKYGSPIFLISTEISKSWGSEKLIINNNKFCGKILIYSKKENYSSFHKHKIKNECFFILNGMFSLKFYNNDNKIEYRILNKGDIVHFPPDTAHQLKALEDDGQIFEISTHDDPDDIVRIEPSMLKL